MIGSCYGVMPYLATLNPSRKRRNPRTLPRWQPVVSPQSPRLLQAYTTRILAGESALSAIDIASSVLAQSFSRPFASETVPHPRSRVCHKEKGPALGAGPPRSGTMTQTATPHGRDAWKARRAGRRRRRRQRVRRALGSRMKPSSWPDTVRQSIRVWSVLAYR